MPRTSRRVVQDNQVEGRLREQAHGLGPHDRSHSESRRRPDMSRLMIFPVVALVAMVLLSTPASATVVTDWNSAALAEVRAGKLGPPVVARALAIAHTCMYDAWAAYDTTAVGTVLGGNLRRPPRERTKANKEKAISFAAYRCLLNLFGDSVLFPATGAAATKRLTDMMVSRGYFPPYDS